MPDDTLPLAPDAPAQPVPAPVPKPKPTPASRIAKAIKGLEPHALPEILAGDVLALVQLVPDEKQTEVTLALAKGSAEAVAGLSKRIAADRTCHPQAGDLAELLEAAGVNAQ